MSKNYILFVDYDHGKYHDLFYNICDTLEKARKSFNIFNAPNKCCNDRMCHEYFICENTEDFVYQMVFGMIFPINGWEFYDELPENKYMDICSYITELLNNNNFVKKNKIHVSDNSFYQDKLYVFKCLLHILNNDRIENRID